MKQKTAFVIDDDPDDLQFMRDALNRVDSSMLCVTSSYPEDAIKLLTQGLIVVPDYIFIDINMPKITGDVCLRMLRADSKFFKTPIILYSTSMPKEVSEKLLQAGASFTFKKPNTENEYVAVVESIIIRKNLPPEYLRR
jgi:CheY-like chemotaxis protein